MKTILVVTPKLSVPGGVSTFWNCLFSVRSEVKKVNVINHQVGSTNLLGAVGDLIGFLRLFFSADIVFLNPSLQKKSFIRDGIYSLVCRLLGKKTIVFFHGWNKQFEEKLERKLLKLFLLFFGRVDQVYVLSNEFKQRINKWCPHLKVNVERTTFQPILSTDLCRNALNPKSNTKLLFLSRLEYEKGIEDAISATLQLRDTGLDIDLDVAGAGPALKSLKSKYANYSSIRFHGNVQGQAKNSLFEHAHIFVLPTYYGEGLPIAILEAMHFSLPVISCDAGGIKDFLKEPECGFIVPSKSPAHIAQAVQLLISDSKKYKSICEFNPAYVKREAHPQALFKRLFEDFYE
ncbi:glycosyltransferase family 4 protein [Alteromonas sp. ASW11-36]|uniref:Glycosyltransferase family 4 protein n=1 Tax=Alteromonas arenosi TaxID=3055817 RepID=A0ABT7T2G1_9ALTE|nr:glycosyltransferase family 4 protein [Alteromonas sp. ASW11-36]MDM7861977.1 glycosyltransferase family 4 protein [Alteromonas sp. ASW11-36]